MATETVYNFLNERIQAVSSYDLPHLYICVFSMAQSYQEERLERCFVGMKPREIGG